MTTDTSLSAETNVVGNVIFAGNNTIVVCDVPRDDTEERIPVTRSLVIQFADDDAIRTAIANRKCEFTLFERRGQ